VDVQRLISGGDFDAAGREIDRLSGDTDRARAATDGILWDLGRHLPIVGADVAAVQTASSALAVVTRDNAPVALRLARAVDAGRLRPRHGRIDVAAIRRLTPAVERAARSIRAQHARLDAVDLDALTFPFDEVLRELAGQVGNAERAASATATAFDLLPGMLGADGPRSYLLLVQNNAEARSTGGIPGSVAVLHADHGRVRMGFQGSAADITAPVGPVPGLPPSVVRVYGDTVVSDLRDTTFDPDFPAVARVAAGMLAERRGMGVAGVLGVDPVALAHLLAATGPVTVEQQGHRVALTQANVVRALLNTTYQVLPDPDAQNDFFEATARAIFDTVMSGRGRSSRAVAGLGAGVAEHRVLLWSRHPGEQRRITGTAVSGELPSAVNDRHPQVGWYLNDAVAGKAEYYLDHQATVDAVSCRRGVQRLDTSIALSSSMPHQHSGLSDFITGTGAFAPRGTIAVNLRLYGPVGGRVAGLTVAGRPVPITVDRHEGRQVAVVPLALAPGQRVVVRARLVSGPGQTAGPVLSSTPGIRSQPNGVRTTSACD
jgi:hypothetical protein